MSILQSTDLTKTYFQGDTHIVAVNRCCLKVEKGEFLSIIGASGSGKSTLLHMLAGLDRPTSGKVFINDTDIYSLGDKAASDFRSRKVGFIFQSFNLLPALTAKENILMPQLIANREKDMQYFDELTELLGSSDRIHHLPSEMSGGQQQRVAIARALINKPEILFADEPTGNLDREAADELIELLVKTRKAFGQTLIIVTHDEKVAERADRRFLMAGGNLEKIKET